MTKDSKGHPPLWRRMGAAVSALLSVWAALPLFTDGIFGIGMALPLLIGGIGLWLSLRPVSVISLKGWRKGMLIAGIVLAALAVLAGGVFTALMFRAAHTPPRENATVVVLGSKIHGDRPSRMMRDRLDLAADFLAAHPQAHCVVAGGLGKGETYTEAYVMKKYLVEQRGIAPERIACEDESVNTYENIHFAMEIVEERGWSTHLAVATQIFHQYRAGQLARMAGADSVGGLACFSPPHLMLNYWVRECAAICRLWLLGY